MATKSIGNNKGRSFLTMLGVIIGIAAVIILVSTVQGQQDAIMAQFEKMGTNQVQAYYYIWNGQDKDYTEELYAYCQELGPDLVLGMSPQLYANNNEVRYKSKRAEYPSVYLASDQYTAVSGFQLASGRDLAYLDIKKLNRVCILGAKVVNDLFNYEDPIGKKITLAGEEYTVIGTYAAKDIDPEYGGVYYDNIIVVPYTLQSRINKQPPQFGGSHEYIIKAASSTATKEVTQKLQEWFMLRVGNTNGYFGVYTQNNWMEHETEGFADQARLLAGIASIALLVGGIGIMNIMLVTVTERTREIGIRKAIGAPRRSIIVQFLIEASMISAIGGVIGIVVGGLGTVVAGKILLDSIIAPPPLIIFIAFIVSIAFGIGFGVYPAVRASRLQPVEALRNE